MWGGFLSDSDDDDGQNDVMDEFTGLRNNPLLESAFCEHIGFRNFQLSYCDKASMKFNVLSFLRAVMYRGKSSAPALKSRNILLEVQAKLDTIPIDSIQLDKFLPYRGKRLHYYSEDYVTLSSVDRTDVINLAADKSIDYHCIKTISVGGYNYDVAWEGQYLIRVDLGSLLLRFHKFQPVLSEDVIKSMLHKKLTDAVKSELEENIRAYQLSRQVIIDLNLSSIQKIYCYAPKKSDKLEGEAFLILEIREGAQFAHKYTSTNFESLNNWKKCSDPFVGKPTTLDSTYHIILGFGNCLGLLHVVQQMMAEHPPLKDIYEMCVKSPLQPGWKSALDVHKPSLGCEEPFRAPQHVFGTPVVPAVALVSEDKVMTMFKAFIGGYKFEDVCSEEFANVFSKDANNNDEDMEQSGESGPKISKQTVRRRSAILNTLVKHDLIGQEKADEILKCPKDTEESNSHRKSAMNNLLGGLKFHECFVDYLNFKCSDSEDLEYLLNKRLEMEDWDMYEDMDEEDLETVRDLVEYSADNSYVGDQVYFSFCWEEVKDDSHDSHCYRCHLCYDWHYWHCLDCDRCSYGQSISKCEHCGRRSSLQNREAPPPPTDFRTCLIRGNKLYSITKVLSQFWNW